MLKFANKIISGLILLNLTGLFLAAGSQEIGNAICGIVNIVEMVMGAVMLILIVMAAIVYAAGQVMGAETRARANVWATSMFLGAIMGGLIYIIVPVFIDALMAGNIGGHNSIRDCCSGDRFTCTT